VVRGEPRTVTGCGGLSGAHSPPTAWGFPMGLWHSPALLVVLTNTDNEHCPLAEQRHSVTVSCPVGRVVRARQPQAVGAARNSRPPLWSMRRLCDPEPAATRNFGARQPPATCRGKPNKNCAGQRPAQLRARFCVPPARRERKPSPLPPCQSVMLRFTHSNNRDDGIDISLKARFGARLQNFLGNVVWII
jgi:hypothetical protein